MSDLTSGWERFDKVRADLDLLSGEELEQAAAKCGNRSAEVLYTAAVIACRLHELGRTSPFLPANPPHSMWLIYRHRIEPELVIKCGFNERAVKFLSELEPAIRREIANGADVLIATGPGDGEHRVLQLSVAKPEELKIAFDRGRGQLRPLEQQRRELLKSPNRRRTFQILAAAEDVDREELSLRAEVGMTCEEDDAAYRLHREENVPLYIARRRVLRRPQ